MRALLLLIASALLLAIQSPLEAQMRYGRSSGWVPYGSYYSAFGNSYGMDRHPNYARQRALRRQAQGRSATTRPQLTPETLPTPQRRDPYSQRQPQTPQQPAPEQSTPQQPEQSTPQQPMPGEQTPPEQQPGQQAPAPTKTLEEELRARESISKFLAAAQLAGLLQQVPAEQSMTIFVPANDSIDATADDWRRLVLNQQKLREGMKRYAADGAVTVDQAVALGVVKSLAGHDLRFSKVGDDVMVNGSKVIEGDIRCTNGVIHIIDRLLPEPAADQN